MNIIYKLILVTLFFTSLIACHAAPISKLDPTGTLFIPGHCERQSSQANEPIKYREPNPHFYDIYFEPDSFEVSEAERHWIKENAKLLRLKPKCSFAIIGHGDSGTSDECVFILGHLRMEAVKKIFIEFFGREPPHMSAYSIGAFSPAENTNSEFAQWKNRRVEFDGMKDCFIYIGPL